MPTSARLLSALPQPVVRAAVLAGADEWSELLRDAGVEVDGADKPDLVVAPTARASEVARIGAPIALLLGRSGARELRRAGFATQRLLPIPSLRHPALLLPLRSPRASAYALSNLSVPPGRIKTLRNRAVGLAASARAPLPGTVIIASRVGELPQLVRESRNFGLPERLDWVLAPGRDVERSSFHLFEPGARRPSWILKFRRERRDPAPFLADARGLRLAAEIGGALAEHAPRLVGISVDREPFSIETAVVGAPLVYVLRAPWRRSEKRAMVEAVAGWLIDVSRQTATPTAGTETVRAIRFPDGVVEAVQADVDELVRGLGPLPSVAEHGDVDPTHVLVQDGSFGVIDWEGAERHGLPLADLTIFLAQVLPILDGELDDPRYGRREAFARLFRGESPSAPLLRGWLREACDAAGLGVEQVGPLLSIVWLRNATPSRRHLAEVWFSDPALGPQWRL
ncbi:MAG: hypothetical protein ACXVY3_04005 [Gaiellaceae bacterium]